MASIPGLHKGLKIPEPVFVIIYGAQGSIPRNRFRQPMWLGGPVQKIGLSYRARICRSFKETRHRFSAWRAGTKSYLSYWPARLHRLAKSIPRNRCLGSINVYKYGLWPARLGIDSWAPQMVYKYGLCSGPVFVDVYGHLGIDSKNRFRMKN